MTATGQVNMSGGWSGNCPHPGCTVWLQGRDSTVTALHYATVHPDQASVVPKPPRRPGRRPKA